MQLLTGWQADSCQLHLPCMACFSEGQFAPAVVSCRMDDGTECGHQARPPDSQPRSPRQLDKPPSPVRAGGAGLPCTRVSSWRARSGLIRTSSPAALPPLTRHPGDDRSSPSQPAHEPRLSVLVSSRASLLALLCQIDPRNPQDMIFSAA